jgi:hypothetical protein
MRHCGHYLTYCTCPGWLWRWRIWWNEMWLAGETEVLRENLPRRHFVHHKSHLPNPGANPGCFGWKPATSRFSYGVAWINLIPCYFIIHIRWKYESMQFNTQSRTTWKYDAEMTDVRHYVLHGSCFRRKGSTITLLPMLDSVNYKYFKVHAQCKSSILHKYILPFS